MNYRNPVFTKDGNIDCEIDHEKYGWIPFTCDPTDTGALFDTKELFDTMSKEAAKYVEPSISTEELAANNRSLRNSLLFQTDFYALIDVTMSDAMKAYRQALRDITTHSNWPNLKDADWPTQP
tara:strand:- start:505 stop:873 length:369 start_codon:yes stop_codon:yes gene_type:complete